MNLLTNILCSLLHLAPALMIVAAFKLHQLGFAYQFLWLLPILLLPYLSFRLLPPSQLKICALEVFHFQLTAMLLYLPLIGLMVLGSQLTGDGQKALAFLFGCALFGVLLVYFLMVLAATLSSLSQPFRYIGIWRPCHLTLNK